MALLDIDALEAGKRVEMGEKKNKTDFALWKFSPKDQKRQQEWESPWGIGFPGWHIECSAMAMKYLGETFDIHTGGEDHIPVHHPNEIAQSEAATGKKFVNYWMHGAFLTFKGEKVSKSTGGLYTVTELEEKGFEPLNYRYLCLLTHYKKQLDFSLDALEAAKNAFDHLKNIMIEMKKDNSSKGNSKKYEEGFLEYINEDLNVPRAMGLVWEMLKDDSLGAKEKLNMLFKFDEVLGLNLKDVKEVKIDIPKEIQELVDKREEARKNKDFDTSDKLRDEIKEKGYILEDSEDGIKVKKV